MDRTKICHELVELFIRLANKCQSIERFPVDYGEGVILYHSERHMLDLIGNQPGMNMSDFAQLSGVTKGAISQVARKLENKDVVRRYKEGANDKEVFIELTRKGMVIYNKQQKVNQESIAPLYEELEKYSDDKVYFLLEMFKWFDIFLDTAKEQMVNHQHKY